MPRASALVAAALVTGAAFLNCAAPPESPAWALAVHGGAGATRAALSSEDERARLAAVEAVLRDGARRLAAGETSLDVVEAVVRALEDDPLFNAGRGAVLNREGTVELDASIMSGGDLACGAVAAVARVRHPVSLARAVMERSGHVLLVGAGAESFADETGTERVDAEWLVTDRQRADLERVLAAAGEGGGTVGAVALDRAGHLAAATSTGGLVAKRPGRVGDSPIIGAGTWADDRTCAVSATGRGEEFIRRSVARSIAAWIEHRGVGVAEAAERVVLHGLAPGDGGVIAVGRDGAIAMPFTTEGMFRGAADSQGRFEVAVWR